MNRRVILAIDQGTTGSRVILYDQQARVAGSSYLEFKQYYPKPGWVEHDADEIWHSVLHVISQALKKAGLRASSIAAIGITNQRETTILWDKKTGKPVSHAIVWQDRRTADFTDHLRKRGFESLIRSKTGLVLDPYFSGSKIRWMLDHISGLKKRAEKGEILFGTIDTWLLWKLTGGQSHATDYTNASRTLLFNIRTRAWDPELLKIFGIPKTLLPEAKESGGIFGKTIQQNPLIKGIPIMAIMGDQQAALYGQSCYSKGSAKNTYGTGCFVVMNMGKKYQKPPFGLLSTLACDGQGKPVFAFEGSIFIAGAVIQWLRDGLHFFKNARETEKMALSVKDNGGVVLIPALAGLGAPYWNPHVRGVISGLTRGTTKNHIIRAALESIAQQTADVIERMQQKAGCPIPELKVDGGATANRFLMQFQADLLGIPIYISDLPESTAWGAAKLAALACGFWRNLKSIDQLRRYERFKPGINPAQRHQLRSVWKENISRLLASSR